MFKTYVLAFWYALLSSLDIELWQAAIKATKRNGSAAVKLGLKHTMLGVAEFAGEDVKRNWVEIVVALEHENHGEFRAAVLAMLEFFAENDVEIVEQ